MATSLRVLKDRKGRSFEALARRLGVSKSALHRYTAGDAVPAQFSIIELWARECDATDQEIAELRRLWQISADRRPVHNDAGPDAAFDPGQAVTVIEPDAPVDERSAAGTAPPAVRRVRSRAVLWLVPAVLLVAATAVTSSTAERPLIDSPGTSGAPAALSGACVARAGVRHVDARRAGHVWRSDYLCPNRQEAALYAEPDSDQKVAVMDTTRSWFVCWTSAVPKLGGAPLVWYYTRGDRSEPGADEWDGWGFVARADVMLDVHPSPVMPECWFAAAP
ncbi:helix-turn-helix domain-containing protein [Dactylosporangium roseum]|uniref:Helix-turn-helix domain-containing protein n=1 Tax=Dactylosporangium roseum TaxID=47989 RepID=A0ABY5ZGJ2_9ACTN|nr:helix-turn-helix domain-containing protein [Dactylosporangium roseum]